MWNAGKTARKQRVSRQARTLWQSALNPPAGNFADARAAYDRAAIGRAAHGRRTAKTDPTFTWVIVSIDRYRFSIGRPGKPIR